MVILHFINMQHLNPVQYLFTDAYYHFYHAALQIKAEDFKKMFKIEQKYYRIWRIIGTELGIDVDTLNDIKRSHLNDDDCLYAVIDSANPVYEMMVKVLQSERISKAVKGLYIIQLQGSLFDMNVMYVGLHLS